MAIDFQDSVILIDKESGFLGFKHTETVKEYYLGVKEVSALAVLLTSEGRRCPKNKIKSALWPERQKVDDSQVATVISCTRKALAKHEIPIALKAITNYGYQVILSQECTVKLV